MPPAALFSCTDDTQLHSVTCVYTYLTRWLAGWLANNESEMLDSRLTFNGLLFIYKRPELFFFSLLYPYANPINMGCWLFTCYKDGRDAMNTIPFFFRATFPLHQMKNIGVLYVCVVIVCTRLCIQISVGGMFPFHLFILFAKSFRSDCNSIYSSTTVHKRNKSVGVMHVFFLTFSRIESDRENCAYLLCNEFQRFCIRERWKTQLLIAACFEPH